ncbi:serine hydrolase [Spirosoma validum]|uniref:beta-lactamase n=1 Tax=Spirosoma validum TaxID=2771355 RepID=A0A927GBN8_9BACT|nr:serine hydrolase [Spirosoma validum]MBD2751675.1 serine hydrolase [Spirosoma validum]
MNRKSQTLHHPNKVGALVPTLFLLLSMATTSLSQSQLTDSLTAYLRHLPETAKVSLTTKSLTNGNVTFSHRADERVPSASVIKLPIMLELMERVKAGSLNLDEIYVLKPSDKVGGSGILQTYADQSRLSYRELLRLMLVESDNTATNILIHRLGRDTINQRMRTIGLKQSQLNRIMMDTLAVKQGRDNYVTAGEMGAVLEKIYRHQVAAPKLCDEMITVLKQVPGNLTMCRLLPKDIAVAHKTGLLAYVRGDTGIIYAKTPFLLSVFVEGVPTPDAERIIGELALICYTYFSR